MLTYNDETHQYFWNGVEVPSLSELLKQNGWYRDLSQVPVATLDLARRRGNEAHAAIAAYLNKEDDYASHLSVDSEPYFESFLKSVDLLPLSDEGVSELPIGGWCGYGTTPDRRESAAIIEWKTTYALHPSVWIQMAGQDYACSNLLGEPKERLVGWMQKDGSPMKIKTDPEPELTMDLFVGTMNQHQWKKKVRWK